MGSLAPSISEFRDLAQDTTTSNLVRGEVPNGVKDGTNKIFRVQYYPVVGTSSSVNSVFLTQNSSVRVQVGFTVDLTNGLITFTSAPAPTDNPFYVDYNFNWFTDTEIQGFLDEGNRALGFPAGTSIDEPLLPAAYQYGLYFYWMRRAAAYAHRYASSGGMAGHSVDVVTKAYRDLADAASKQADYLKAEYYKRQGRREAPNSNTFNYKIDPYTPIR